MFNCGRIFFFCEKNTSNTNPRNVWGGYTLENWHVAQKWRFGRWCSFSIGWFFGEPSYFSGVWIGWRMLLGSWMLGSLGILTLARFKMIQVQTELSQKLWWLWWVIQKDIYPFKLTQGSPVGMFVNKCPASSISTWSRSSLKSFILTSHGWGV